MAAQLMWLETLSKGQTLPSVVIDQSAQSARHILLYRPMILDVCPALHLKVAMMFLRSVTAA